jgi:hypothetical protein
LQPVSISCGRAQAQHYLDVYELRSLATLIGPCAPAQKPAKPNPPPHTRLRLRRRYVCAGLGLSLPHLYQDLTLSASAPRLGSPRPVPHLHRDWARPVPHLRFLPPSLGEWHTPSTARFSSLWLMGACMHGAAWVPHTDRGCACDGDAQGRARLHVGPHAWCACARACACDCVRAFSACAGMACACLTAH